MAGLWLSLALTYNHSFAEGLAYTAFFGSLAVIVLFPVIAGGLMIGRHLFRPWLPAAAPLVAATLVATSFVVAGLWESRPSTRFAREVLDPMPAGVTDLRLFKAASFGDGHAWYFAFRAPPGTFDAIAKRHGLTGITLDEHRAVTAEFGPDGDLAPPAAEVPFTRLSEPAFYRRPAGARFFTGERASAATNADGTEFYFYADHFRRPKTEQ